MHSVETNHRLNEEAVQAALKRKEEKYTTSLLQRKTLPIQPFVVFTYDWVQGWRHAEERKPCVIAGSLKDFGEALLFLLCFLDEIESRIKRKEFTHVGRLGVEHIVHGVACQLDAHQFLQLARDCRLLRADGKLNKTPASPPQVDLAFLALASATNGVVKEGVTGAKVNLKKEWQDAIQERRAAIEKK